jgi:hypothetical protein
MKDFKKYLSTSLVFIIAYAGSCENFKSDSNDVCNENNVSVSELINRCSEVEMIETENGKAVFCDTAEGKLEIYLKSRYNSCVTKYIVDVNNLKK